MIDTCFKIRIQWDVGVSWEMWLVRGWQDSPINPIIWVIVMWICDRRFCSVIVECDSIMIVKWLTIGDVLRGPMTNIWWRCVYIYLDDVVILYSYWACYKELVDMLVKAFISLLMSFVWLVILFLQFFYKLMLYN